MKRTQILPKVMIILLVIIGLASCDEDFTSLDSEVINKPINDILDETKTVVTYSRKFLPVATNGLPTYQLGVYNDPVYGKSTVTLQSQVTLSENNPDFGVDVELDSVVLYIPYFSNLEINDGIRSFTLDSIYGNQPIDIKIYESNFFLRDLDPDSNFEDPQLYYSNQAAQFEGFLGQELASIEDFKPSASEIVFFEDDSDKEMRINPGLYQKLPNDFFQEKIIDQEGMSALLNNNNFREFFRGLYFDVQSSSNDGSLFLFDMDEAFITLYYTRNSTSDTDDNSGPDETDDDGRAEDTFNLRFASQNVNVFKNDLNPGIASDLFNPDFENGEETLYVRGGDGIVTIIELFGKTDEISFIDGAEVLEPNGVSDELDRLREDEWLITEANLKFYIDKDKVTGGSQEPERLSIYDAVNGSVLADYAQDVTGGYEDVDAYNQHLGRIVRDSDDNGEYYEMNITHHLKNLINRDSTNIPLALVVSSNVTIQEYQSLQNPQSPGIFKVPAATVVSPEGTVLYGNNTTNEAKRLKLQIYYTEINED